MGKKKRTLRKGRNAKRKRIVLLQKIGIGAVLAAVTAGGIYAYNQLPKVRVDKCINQALKYEEAQDYANALAAYEEALEIESGTVKAYRYMANLYLDMENYQAAEEILYRGLSQTQDAEIEETYYTVMLNESVYEINEENCSFITVERCLEILDADSEMTGAYDLLQTCYDRLVTTVDEQGRNIIWESAKEGFGFESYQSVIETMISLYERDGKAEMKELLGRYIGIQAEIAALPMEYFESYRELVSKVNSIVNSSETNSLHACLEKAAEIRELFAPLLAEFEQENYDVARDFIVSDEYVAIRDAFIEETMEYWSGKTYIPVSDIGLYLHYEEGNWTFSFMDEEKQPAKYGYIKVWGFKWLDNGHQRTVISYVPVSETGEYYPLTEYSMMYWWSTPINMELTENTYARMNFRFEENTYTEEGKTTKAINDWGGRYEYKDVYE